MQKSKYKLFFIFAVLLFISCKTTPTEDEKLLNAQDFSHTQSVEEETQIDGAPTSLWSPEQRKANAGHYFMLAEYKMLNKEMNLALDLYEEAYNLDPNEFLGTKLIAAKLQSGVIDNVQTEAKKMVLLYPKSAKLHALYGHVLIEKKQFSEAIKEFLIAVEMDDSNEEFYGPLVTLYQQEGKNDVAIKYAKQLTVKKPDSIVGWSLLSRLYVLKGDHKNALAPAKICYELQDINPESILVYAYILELNKKTAEAVSMYEKLYRMNPTNEKLIARMLALYQETGGLKEALNILDEMAARPEGDSPGIHLQRAYILWELQEFQKAADILIKLSKEYTKDERIRYLTGLAYERIKKPELAMIEYESISEKSEFKKYAQIRKVIILQSKDQFQQALDEIDVVIQQEDVEPNIFLIKASIQAEMVLFKESVETLNQGLIVHPNNIQLLFSRGVNEEKLQEVEKCIETMREVIKFDPNHSSALNYLGYIYAERGENLDEAESLIKRALVVKPNDGFFLDSLGWVYFKKGDLNKALKTLHEALKLVPDEGVILEHIGDVYLAQKVISLAKEFFGKALKTELDPKDRVRIEKKFNAIKN